MNITERIEGALAFVRQTLFHDPIGIKIHPSAEKEIVNLLKTQTLIYSNGDARLEYTYKGLKIYSFGGGTLVHGDFEFVFNEGQGQAGTNFG